MLYPHGELLSILHLRLNFIHAWAREFRAAIIPTLQNNKKFPFYAEQVRNPFMNTS